ncbi:hypothetical protein [Pedobacter sp. KACC 23697]|uniref:Uncharacterized protein n=1 Tax=Pedobacter sp. KACC 23697 TaxID=3149230 RepID=A0AAU7K7T3_9SPHI
MDKFDDVPILNHHLKSKLTEFSLKVLLHCQRNSTPIHWNFQGLKSELSDLARSLFIEFSNDIYLNHYDLPAIKDGDLVKRRSDGEYYKVIKTESITFRLNHIPRKTKKDSFPANIPEIRYDKLALKYLKVSAGVSEKTIKNYFDFFEKLNNEKSEFPRTHFEKKSVFITKKTLWDELPEKSKIPSIYLPNPREENGISEIKSIPALSDCLTYFTPKYEVCYQNILLKGEKIKTIIVFDTEADKIQQILQDKVKFGFNLIVLSNSVTPLKNEGISCWNWFREETEILKTL